MNVGAGRNIVAKRWQWWSVVAVIALLGWVLSAGTACQYESSLDDLSCVDTSQCPDGSACDDGFCVALPGPGSIELDESSRTVTAGETANFVATVYDEDGEVLEEVEVNWSSGDDAIASVDESGAVTGEAVGTALITAEAGGLRASAAVSVSDVPVSEIVADEDSITIEEGRHEFVAVELRDGAGNILSDRQIFWESDDDSVAEVSARGDGTGVIFAADVGFATLTVSSGGVETTVDVEVTERSVAVVEVIPGEFSMTEQTSLPLGEQDGAFVEVYDDRGARLDRDVTWESDNTEVLSIEDDAGVLTLRAASVEEPTQVTLSATSDGITGEAVVTVSPMDVAAVDVSPSGIQIEQYQIYTGFSADILSPEGEVIDGGNSAVSWESSDESIVTVSVDGGVVEVEAHALGTAEISAVYNDEIQATAFVTVVSETIEELNVVPSAVDVAEGQQEGVTVELVMASAEAPGDRDVVWSSDDADVATVNPTGDFTATILGHMAGESATVTADVDGLSATVDVVVEPRQLAGVSVTPGSLTLKQGQDFQLTATVLGDDGRSLPGESVSWEVCDGTGLSAGDWSGCQSDRADIDGSGVISAMMDGDVSIRAVADSDNSITGEAELTVQRAPVINVELTPSIVELVIGDASNESMELSYEAITINGASVDRNITFEIDDGAVASVADGAGQTVVVSAENPGDTLLEATADAGTSEEPAVGQAFVFVSAEPVDSLSIEPADSASWTGTVMVGESSVQLTASAEMRSGTIAEDVDAIWWSSEPDKLAIDDDGFITALSPATAVEVHAFYEGELATMMVDVVDFDTNDISIDPASITIPLGESRTLDAEIDNGQGCPVALGWESLDPAIAVVDGAGRVAALGVGDTTIRVSCGDAEATANVTVTSAPDSVAIHEDGGSAITTLEIMENENVDLDGVVNYIDAPANECQRIWKSSDHTVASVQFSGDEATVFSQGIGTATITLECGGEEATVALEVVEYAPDSVEILWPASGDPSFMEVGQWEVFEVEIDADASVECEEPLQWESSDSSLAPVDSEGLVDIISGTNGDTVEITVSCAGVEDSVTVEIADEPTDIIIECDQDCDDTQTPITADHDTGKLYAEALYNGEAFDGCTPAWSSSDPNVDVDQSGNLSGSASGDTTTITVTCGGASSDVDVYVGNNWDQ